MRQHSVSACKLKANLTEKNWFAKYKDSCFFLYFSVCAWVLVNKIIMESLRWDIHRLDIKTCVSMKPINPIL